MAVDGGDERMVGVAPHLAELLDRRDTGRAQRVDAAGAVRLHEVGKGPAGLAQLHVRQAEAHRVACTLQVAFASPFGRRRSRGGVEDAHIGIAVFRRHEAREVEARVLHDDRRRHHGPGDVAVAAAGQQTDEGEDGQDRDPAHAATVAMRALPIDDGDSPEPSGNRVRRI